MAADETSGNLALPWSTSAVLGTGAIVAMAVAAAPADVLGPLVAATGLPDIVPAAAPPLGTTARTILALLIGGVAATLLWCAIRFVPWSRLIARATPSGDDAPEAMPGADAEVPEMFARWRRPVEQKSADEVPVLRRADAHPDAPARRPIHASTDFGTPLSIAPEGAARPIRRDERLPAAIQPLPADLDQPLAAFDPEALPPTPRTPVRVVAPLVIVPEPVLAPVPAAPMVEAPVAAEPVAAVPEPIAPEPVPVAVASKPTTAPEPVAVIAPAPIPPEPATIGSLLDRLERATRVPTPPRSEPSPAPACEPDPAPDASIEDTLGMLRKLAAG